MFFESKFGIKFVFTSQKNIIIIVFHNYFKALLTLIGKARTTNNKNHFLHDFLMDVQASPLWKDTKIALTVVFMLLHLYCTLEFEIIVADVLNDLFPWLLMTADKQS